MGCGENSDMQELVGKKILGLTVSDGEHVLAFETETDVIAYEAEGDCCSTSWFADIIGVRSLLGGTVTSISTLDLPNPEDDRTRQEYDAAYGYSIRTERGTCDVIFRNSSNGYYGGWIERTEKVPARMTPITEDWQA